MTKDGIEREKLKDLYQQIIGDDVCSGLAETATQLVFGTGNPTADIVLIGEAPGKKEDETGRPFVGASGKFLDEMLAAAGMKRDDVYITNIVKYRPPNNRDPSSKEKQEFLPYLIKQLEIIQPRAIITLGRHSGSVFIPDLVISRDHGQSHQVSMFGLELLIIPLYHPAAALYNSGLRQTLIDDFRRASKITRQL